MHPLIQNGFQQLLTEVQKINIHLNNVESANKNILTNQQRLTGHAQQSEIKLKEVQDSLGAMTTGNTSKDVGGKNPKNISNQHPGLKVSDSLLLS